MRESDTLQTSPTHNQRLSEEENYSAVCIRSHTHAHAHLLTHLHTHTLSRGTKRERGPEIETTKAHTLSVLRPK